MMMATTTDPRSPLPWGILHPALLKATLYIVGVCNEVIHFGKVVKHNHLLSYNRKAINCSTIGQEDTFQSYQSGSETCWTNCPP